MPRTFSLARLMLYVTLVAVAFGLLVNFPDTTRNVLIGAGLIAPMFFLWLGLNEEHRIGMVKFAASFAGGLVGMYFMRILIETKRLHLDFNGCLAIGVISVASTFLPLGAIVLGEHCWRRYRQ